MRVLLAYQGGAFFLLAGCLRYLLPEKRLQMPELHCTYAATVNQCCFVLLLLEVLRRCQVSFSK